MNDATGDDRIMNVGCDNYVCTSELCVVEREETATDGTRERLGTGQAKTPSKSQSNTKTSPAS